MKNINKSINQSVKRVLAALIICFFALGILLPVSAAAENQMLQYGAKGNSIQYGPQSKEELEEFLDGYLKKEMEKEHIPGLMISFVKDGKLILNKGYGVTDVKTGEKVDPQSSLMGVCSLGKPVTAAAIMKLVGEGKIDLKNDVNNYLKGFKLKNKTGKSITVEQLLLHTGGFEDNRSVYGTKDLKKSISLSEYVKKYQPEVIYEPGSVQSYSNYGYALLGYIIEQVTGRSYGEYLREEIFLPLRMDSSTIRQIPDLPDKLAKAYSYNNSTNAYEEVEQAYWYMYSAGVLLTNTEELSHLMLFLLNGGRYNNQQIISNKSIEQLLDENFTPHPDLHGIAGKTYGFSNWKLNGHPTLQKSGGGSGWNAHMVLLPEYGQGFAYTYNTENGAFSDGLRQAIADRFYPSIVTKQPKLNMSKKELSEFEGYYRYVQSSHTTLEKLLTAVSPQFNERIVANDDGTISVGVMFISQMVKYEPISPSAFQKVEGEKAIEVPGMKLDLGERIAFQKDKDGKIEYVFLPYEDLAVKKISYFEYGQFQLIIIAGFSLTSLVFILYWMIGGAIKLARKKLGEISNAQNIAGWSSCLSAFSILLFLFIMVTNLNGSIVYGMPSIIKIGLVIPVLSIGFFAAAALFTVKAWRQKLWKLPSRILYTLFTIANFVFLGWAWYYNLIGWQF